MSIVLTLHDLVRWLIIIFAFWTVFASFGGLVKHSGYSKKTNLASLLFMIGMDVQVLLGMLLYFNNGWFDKLKHLGVYMHDTNQRFFVLEHWFLMLIAWALVHAGRTFVGKAVKSQEKYKKTLIYFGLALLLILIAIPWPFRDALARPWFRWFSLLMWA